MKQGDGWREVAGDKKGGRERVDRERYGVLRKGRGVWDIEKGGWGMGY